MDWQEDLQLKCMACWNEWVDYNYVGEEHARLHAGEVPKEEERKTKQGKRKSNNFSHWRTTCNRLWKQRKEGNKDIVLETTRSTSYKKVVEHTEKNDTQANRAKMREHVALLQRPVSERQSLGPILLRLICPCQLFY